MSKLARIRLYQYYGDPGFLDIIKKGASLVSGIVKKGGKNVKQLVQKAGSMVGSADVNAILGQLGLTPNGGGAAASGGMGRRRRSRGITARELRGYRKVANLLHREGMVSRKSRGRR